MKVKAMDEFSVQHLSGDPLKHAMADHLQDEWGQFVGRLDKAHPMQLAQWFAVIGDSFDVTQHLFVVRSKNDPQSPSSPPMQAFMHLWETNTPLFGHYLSTLDGGLVTSGPQASEALYAALDTHLANSAAKHAVVRGECGEESLRSAPAAYTAQQLHLVIALPDTHSEMLSRLSKKTRNQIRRGEKLDPRVEVLDQIPDAFFDIYARLMRDLGTPTTARSFFAAMNQHLGSHLKFVGIYVGERLVAGGVLIVHGDTCFNLFAANEPQAKSNYANYVLYNHMLKWAIEQGFSAFDMGRSAAGGGHHAFKLKWRPEELRFDYGLRGKDASSVKLTSSARGGLVNRVWQKLPLVITNRVGPLLRRSLPFG